MYGFIIEECDLVIIRMTFYSLDAACRNQEVTSYKEDICNMLQVLLLGCLINYVCYAFLPPCLENWMFLSKYEGFSHA